MLDLFEFLLHTVGRRRDRGARQGQVVICVALREGQSLVSSLQAERVGAQDGVLLPATAFCRLAHQRQPVEEEQQIFGGRGLHLPHRGCRGRVEGRLQGKSAEGAKTNLLRSAMNRIFAQIVVGVFEGDLDVGLDVGLVQIRQIAETSSVCDALQQFLRGILVAMRLAQPERGAGQGQGLGVVP